MKMSDVSIKRPVFAVVISLLLVVLGIMSFSRLTLRELPNIDPPIVSVESGLETTSLLFKLSLTCQRAGKSVVRLSVIYSK